MTGVSQGWDLEHQPQAHLMHWMNLRSLNLHWLNLRCLKRIERNGSNMMNLAQELNEARARLLRRRWFLKDCSVGLGSLAALELLAGDSSAQESAGPLAAHA